MKILKLLKLTLEPITKYILLLFFVIGSSTYSHSQDKNLSWDELSQQYKVPEWFTNARFGVWVHWGAQSVPEYGGGWYARHMYMQNVGKETFGKNAYSYHLKTFGHPSVFGFKDVANAWKAEKLNTDSLLEYFTTVRLMDMMKFDLQLKVIFYM